MGPRSSTSEDGYHARLFADRLVVATHTQVLECRLLAVQALSSLREEQRKLSAIKRDIADIDAQNAALRSSIGMVGCFQFHGRLPASDALLSVTTCPEASSPQHAILQRCMLPSSNDGRVPVAMRGLCHLALRLQVDVKGLKDQRDALQAQLGEAEALQTQVVELSARAARLPALQAEALRLLPLSTESARLEAQLGEMREMDSRRAALQGELAALQPKAVVVERLKKQVSGPCRVDVHCTVALLPTDVCFHGQELVRAGISAMPVLGSKCACR